MRVTLFGGDAALAESLGRAGLPVARAPLSPPATQGATAALSAALRGAEEALAGDPPGAVLVGGDGDEALAVALTAVKLEIPTAWLAPAGAPGGALLGRVADLRLDATTDAEAVAASVRDLAASTIPAR